MVKQKLLAITRATRRRKHLGYRTKQAYIYWMRKFILFHGKRHPVEMAEGELQNGMGGGLLWSCEGSFCFIGSSSHQQCRSARSY